MKEQNASTDDSQCSESSQPSAPTPSQDSSFPDSGDPGFIGTVFEGLSDPFSLKDLVVEDSEKGFTLSAPDDSPAGKWLQYWSSREEEFSILFMDMLRSYLDSVNGQTEGIEDETEREATGRTRGQEDQAGDFEANHPICDI